MNWSPTTQYLLFADNSRCWPWPSTFQLTLPRSRENIGTIQEPRGRRGLAERVRGTNLQKDRHTNREVDNLSNYRHQFADTRTVNRCRAVSGSVSAHDGRIRI